MIKTTFAPSDTLSSSEQNEKNFATLSSVDELAEFYDPYSDLNLFLVQKITQEMRHCGNSKKWSLKIQEELFKKISPDFKKKFPYYRLGVTALKRTWEKITYYSQHIQQQKEAITQDGKLNVHFFIRENLKQFASFKNFGPLHPSHFAHRLSVKMSECIATIDGIRPKLEHLTQLIWSVQRHLLRECPPEHFKSPYDEYDKVDQLIVKTILEISAKDPHISHEELEFKVRESLDAVCALPSFASLESITVTVAALLAEKLYPSSRFHILFSAEQKNALIYFIKRHSALCKSSENASARQLVRRIIALYTLASGLPKDLTDEEIVQAADFSEKKHPQSVYAFISAERVLMRQNSSSEALVAVYKEATSLPLLKPDELDILELVIWKTLSQTEGLLEKLPYQSGMRIEEEIAQSLIENPKKSFSSLVQAAAGRFKNVKELILLKKEQEIERKIHTWVVQGEMLYRWIQLETDNPLMQLICHRWKSNSHPISHSLFVSHVCQDYLKLYPELSSYAGQLTTRVWILYKHAWYTLFSSLEESSYERFLKWHALCFSTASLSKEECQKKLQEIVKKTLPLVPFDPEHCDRLLNNGFLS